MAEKTIGINIQLNGVTGVVKDIKTFEDEIKKAKQDLKELEIGSDLFVQLQKEIGQAETQLLSLITSTKRLTREREIEGIGKLGQGIASSFAAAQSAVALFGTESEEVSKAATQAQNLLTLALSARGIAEIKLGAELVARTIAQRAATAADLAAIGPLKTLFTLIANNPYTALLTVLGALVAAYIAFGDAEEEAAEKTKTLNELLVEQDIAATKQINQLEILTTILFDVNSSLDAQAGAYKQLQKLVPDLAGKNLDLKNSQDEINKSIEREIKLIQLRAKQKALEQYFVDQESKAIKKREEERQRFLGTIQVEIAQERQRLLQAGLTMEETEKQIRLLEQRKLSAAGYALEQDNLVEITREIVTLEAQQQKEVDKTAKANKKAKVVTKDRANEIRALSQAIKEFIKAEQERLVNEFKLGDFEPYIIGQLKERLEKQKELTASTNKLKTAQEMLNEVNAQLGVQENVVGEYYEDILKATDALTGSINSIKLFDSDRDKKVRDSLKEYKQIIFEFSQQPGLQEEYRKEFLEIGKLVENSVNQLEEVLKISPQFDINAWEKTLEDLAISRGDILFDPQNRTQEKLTEDIINAEERYAKIKLEFIERFKKQQTAEQQSRIDALKLLANESNKNEKERLDAQNQLNEVYREFENTGSKIFDNLYQNTVQFKIMKNAVADVTQEVVDMNNELRKGQEIANLGAIVDNAEEFAKQYVGFFDDALVSEQMLSDLQEKLRKKDFSQDAKYGKLLMALNNKIADELYYIDENNAKQRIDISKLTYEEQLDLLETFLEQEVDMVKKAEDKKQKKREESTKKLIDGLKVFSDAIQTIASLEAQYTELRLDRLEQDYKRTLNNVIGESEAAAQKRADIEKEFQAEKAAIEKAALIKSLQFQLIQTIADVAQAIASNIENPVVAVIAGIAGAFQVDIIRRQIQLAQAAAGGTIVKGRKHEYGGVRASGGLEVEGGEAIINRMSTINYQGLLSSINTSGGGQALIANASNSLMEERLVQAIAKQRQEPIRAYVLGSEITNAQAINKRLEELSTL